MNPVVRAQVREFVTTNALTERSESEQFEIYSIYSILNGALGESVEPVDAHLTGSEFGVDGIAIMVQGRLIKDTDDADEAVSDIKSPEIDFYFFQSKTGTSYDYGSISKFFDAITGFFRGEMNGESPQLDDLIAAKEVLYDKAVGRKNPGLHAYYASTGTYEKADRIEKLIDRTVTELGDLNIFDNDRLTISMVGARDLQRFLSCRFELGRGYRRIPEKCRVTCAR